MRSLIHQFTLIYQYRLMYRAARTAPSGLEIVKAPTASIAAPGWRVGDILSGPRQFDLQLNQ
jgi:hypothetical protein